MTETAWGRQRRRSFFAVILACGLLAVVTQSAGAASPQTLVGTFKITPGSCQAKTQSIKGSYFRVIFPGGTLKAGPFFQNANSRCSDNSFTPVRPGTEGGFLTGSFQPNPTPTFTRQGGATANVIIQPVSFTGVNLSLSTNPRDPQAKRRVPPPSIFDQSGTLSGQMQALSAAWNKTFINQGSPKPGGHLIGQTTAVAGRYNVVTHAYTLTWSSQAQGGQFAQFVWYWHLEGTFIAGQGGASTTTVPSTPAPARSTPSHRKPDLAKDVDLLNCGAEANRWSAGGVVKNDLGRAATYLIKVKFLTDRGRIVATGSTSVPLRSKQSNLWSAKARHSARSGSIRCVVTGVSAN